MKLGKAVDSENNLGVGIGGLVSFGDRFGIMYQYHYKGVLEGDKIKSLFNKRKII
jgi:hypothetical protein